MNRIVRLEDLAQLTPSSDTVLAIGVFDGVHLGHQYLLRLTAERARQLGCLSGAITFHPHPRQVLMPENGPGYLLSLEERLELISEQGIELIVTLSFTRELAMVPAADFMAGVKAYLRLRELFVGANFALGRGREGTPERLVRLGQDMGFAVQVVQPLEIDGVAVSSTAIRQALQEGEVELAARLMGRAVTISGKVIPGRARGQLLGFPTANLCFDPERVVPAFGVYAVRVWLDDQVCSGVANLGVRPTFDSGEPCLEVHLMDFQADLYGRVMRVEFVRRLRPEIRFATPADLVAQIRRDIEQAREVLGATAGCTRFGSKP